MRDLGGLRSVAGTTRHGVLFRSEAPRGGDPLPGSILRWPTTTVVDLRSSYEIKTCHPWTGVAHICRLPLLSDSTVTILSDANESTPGQRLELVYHDIVENAAPRLAMLISWAAAADGAIHIHCAAGKDRTGIAVAVLLLAAGVHPDPILRDYSASSGSMTALAEKLDGTENAPPFPAWHTMPKAAPAELLSMVIDSITDAEGGIGQWTRSHGIPDSDIDRWKQRLVG